MKGDAEAEIAGCRRRALALALAALVAGAAGAAFLLKSLGAGRGSEPIGAEEKSIAILLAVVSLGAAVLCAVGSIFQALLQRRYCRRHGEWFCRVCRAKRDIALEQLERERAERERLVRERALAELAAERSAAAGAE